MIKFVSVNARLINYVVRVGLALVLVLALGLIYLLVQAVDHRNLNEQNLEYLLVVNAAVATLLLMAIGTMAWRLWQRLRTGRFGSKLLVKLAAIFALVGVLPSVLIYSVSYQFVSRSISSWFDVSVEGALEAGLNLGRASLDQVATDLTRKARESAKGLQLNETSETSFTLSTRLDRLREQLGVADAQIWSHAGVLLASSGESRFLLTVEKPTAQQMRSLKTQRSISVFEGLEAGATASRLRVIVPIESRSLDLAADPLYLVMVEVLPASIVSNALAVQTVYDEYQARALSRSGLQQMYIGTLTLSWFLAILSAFILAVVLGNQLVKPLLVLAHGVERVSAGDLSPQLVLSDDDELAGLTRSFASMTQQLSNARLAEQKNERIKAWNEVAQRVAHEIKNPLTPIQLSAERLAHKLRDKLQGGDAALLDKSVKTIVDQVEAMKRLVNEFRDYARLPSAQMKPISLVEVIEDTLLLYEHEVRIGCIDFVVETDNLNIQGDVQQLRQVFHNLLQNALDAARSYFDVAEGTPSVKIRLSADEGKQMLRCQIEDNGAGFSEQILSRAFEPYNTTKLKGTGLGLAVVRKIVQDHQGEISLCNKPQAQGLGACVVLLFPLLARSASASLA